MTARTGYLTARTGYRIVAGATAGVIGLVAAAAGGAAHGGRVDGTGDQYVLNNAHTSAGADVVYTFGSPTAAVLVGDWDGDGADTFAVRSGSTYLFRNTHDAGDPDLTYSYGRPGDDVLVGDWDGDGIDTLAVRRGNRYFLKNTHAGGAADVVYAYGRSGDLVIVGNWDGISGDTLAVRRGNTFHLKNSHAGGAADLSYAYGRPDDGVLTGDWDGSGSDTLGIRRDDRYHLKNSHAGGGSDVSYSFGVVGELAFAGDWDGNGTDTLALRRVDPQDPVDPLNASLVDLGTLGGASSLPVDVNDRGQVVGRSQTADGSWHAFLWENGVMTDLDAALPGGRARDINNRGEVVLSGPSGGLGEESVLWSTDDVIRLGQVEAIKVNEQGQVGGVVSVPDESGTVQSSPFLWTAGTRVDVEPIPGWASESSRFVDLNDDGVLLAVGLGPESLERAYTWADGEVTVLETLATSIQNVAMDLNDRGQVVGYDHVPGRSPTGGAYLWEPDGFRYIMRFDMTQHVEPEAISDRGQITGTGSAGAEPPEPTEGSRALFWNGTRVIEIGPEGESSIGLDVNDRAQVVGHVRRPQGDEDALSRGFIWQAGRSVLLPVPGTTTASEAIVVSEAGHVLGSITDASGAQHAVLWRLGGPTPVS